MRQVFFNDSKYVSVYLSVCLHVSLPTYLSTSLSFELCKLTIEQFISPPELICAERYKSLSV